MSEMAPLGQSSLRNEIEAADRRFMDAFNSGDIAGAARGIYTEDARVLPPGGEMVQGRDNIVQFWQGAAEQMGIRRVELRTVEVEPVGEGAYQVGRATISLAGEQQIEGKYVVIWRQEGGEWRWHVDIWNMNA